MKPKTKEQKKVWKLYKKLRKEPYVKVLKWHFNDIVENYANISKAGTASCFKCGHSWKEKMGTQNWQNEIVLEDTKCPKCKRKLKVEITNIRTGYMYSYFSTINTIEDYQVIRTYQIRYDFKAKQKATSWNRNVFNMFISPEGKETFVGMYKMNHFTEQWCGTNEVRGYQSHIPYNEPHIYPVCEVIDKLNRNGFLNEFYDNNPSILFHKLLTNNICETLWKAGQHTLVKYFDKYSESKLKEYWGSIKICLRNDFFIESPQEWFDHLELLEHYGKDLLNPKYVCPENFHKEHQKYIERKRKEDKKKAYRKLQAQIIDDETNYQKHIKKYKDFSITSGNLIIKPILNVKQLEKESNLLRHCAYSSKYHKKENSLMLTASYKDEILETIQFDLDRYEISQSRGLSNKNSKYHNKIVKLVNSYSKEIMKLKNPIKKRKKKTQKQAA